MPCIGQRKMAETGFAVLKGGIFYDKTVADVCLRLFREKGFQLATASV
jgi:hypothetical protein